jgi:hypothetical protein
MSVGLISIIYIAFVLSRLSKRLGEVSRMPTRAYRGFYLALSLLTASLLTLLLRISALLAPEKAPAFLTSAVFHLLFHYIPLAIGVTICLIVTIRYWGWLIKGEELWRSTPKKS